VHTIESQKRTQKPRFSTFTQSLPICALQSASVTDTPVTSPAYVQDGKLGRSQTVAEGDKDHGGIPVTPAIGLGGIDQPIDLDAGQVLAGRTLMRPARGRL
jgi:hypothetical protein